MNLADRLAASSPRPATSAGADAEALDRPSMGDVVARIAAEVSGPLTQALDRVAALTATGRIDRAGLQSLRDEIEGARRVGMRGQQIARFAAGTVQQRLERLDLTRILRDVLDEQVAQSSAVAGRPILCAAEVMGDASLVHAVLQAAAGWSAPLARASIDWRLELASWPVRARVQCRFAHGAADLAPAEPAEDHSPAAGTARLERLDTLDWLLLQYTAHMASVLVRRVDGPSHTSLTLEFVNTVNDTLEGASAVELDSEPGAAAPLLTGSQVLVLAARREARSLVRAAMHGHELFIDYVPSVEAARQYCEDGAPQVLLFESSFRTEALHQMLDRLQAGGPGLALIEITPTGHGCEMGGPSGHDITRIGADGLRQMLPSVMLLELARRR